MEVVINADYGGFGLSHEALLWLHERGCKSIVRKATEYFGNNTKDLEKAKKVWKQYLEDKKDGIFVYTFSPDMEYILSEKNYEKSFRSDPLVIECVKTLKEKANDRYSALEVITIPDNINWEIDEYDGLEHIEEVHRRWP